MNKLFNMFGQSQNTGPLWNMANLVSQFNQFRQTFQGDPNQEVQKLLNSGQMSQEQYNKLSQMAQTFSSLVRR